MKKTYKPGEKSPVSAQFEIIGSRGGRTGVERTAVKGKTLPPTPGRRQSYLPVDPTKNDSGRI